MFSKYDKALTLELARNGFIGNPGSMVCRSECPIALGMVDQFETLDRVATGSDEPAKRAIAESIQADIIQRNAGRIIACNTTSLDCRATIDL